LFATWYRFPWWEFENSRDRGLILIGTKKSMPLLGLHFWNTNSEAYTLPSGLANIASLAIDPCKASQTQVLELSLSLIFQYPSEGNIHRSKYAQSPSWYSLNNRTKMSFNCTHTNPLVIIYLWDKISYSFCR
jgi:hypothetical protein